MQDYKPNSHRFKEEQKKKAAEEKERKIEKVVSNGSAKIKKKSELSKFTSAFISEDVSNVKSHVVSDVIIPAAKKLIYDIVKDGIDMLLYGTSGNSGRSTVGSKVSYSKMYDDPRDRRSSTTSKSRFDFDDLVFESRGVAEAVRAQMQEVIERYGFVTVADMYDMADVTQPYTSNKYGWINISSSEIVRIRDGYIIKLPKPAPID